jgi:hypothetical protein
MGCVKLADSQCPLREPRAVSEQLCGPQGLSDRVGEMALAEMAGVAPRRGLPPLERKIRNSVRGRVEICSPRNRDSAEARTSVVDPLRVSRRHTIMEYSLQVHLGSIICLCD